MPSGAGNDGGCSLRRCYTWDLRQPLPTENMAIYFNLAHGSKALDAADQFAWPYDIDVCFDHVAHPVRLSEGVAHGSAAATVTVHDALQQSWRAHFEMTGALWLIPYLEGLASGVALPKQEMLSEYQKRTGKLPRRYSNEFA